MAESCGSSRSGVGSEAAASGSCTHATLGSRAFIRPLGEATHRHDFKEDSTLPVPVAERRQGLSWPASHGLCHEGAGV